MALAPPDPATYILVSTQSNRNKMSKPSNLTVKPRRKESQERMIKRFIKKCKKLGIIDEVKDRRFFKSNSEKRNEVKRKRRRAIAKAKEKGKR